MGNRGSRTEETVKMKGGKGLKEKGKEERERKQGRGNEKKGKTMKDRERVRKGEREEEDTAQGK
jgi:hypothetical protein